MKSPDDRVEQWISDMYPDPHVMPGVASKFLPSPPPRMPRNEPWGDPDAKTPNEEPWITPPHWKRLDVANLSEWQCEPLVPIIDGILARGNLAFIVAASQTGKTLLGLYLARMLVQGGKLFGKYLVTPMDRLAYLLLEDPDRRARDRILDTAHEFATLKPERFVIHIAPSFNLMDPQMWKWLESMITAEQRQVVILDTYQKATPGLLSYDDKEQSIILHRLADLTRRLQITLLVKDHFRKTGTGKNGMEMTLDDVKGTGGKVQNADCLILMQRTPDRTQIKFQSYSKDFDNPVRILLDVAPAGTTDRAKFTYAGDLDQLGATAKQRGEANRQKVLDAFKPDERLRRSEIVQKTGFNDSTVGRHLGFWLNSGKLDAVGKGPAARYWLKSTQSAEQHMNGFSES